MQQVAERVAVRLPDLPELQDVPVRDRRGLVEGGRLVPVHRVLFVERRASGGLTPMRAQEVLEQLMRGEPLGGHQADRRELVGIDEHGSQALGGQERQRLCERRVDRRGVRRSAPLRDRAHAVPIEGYQRRGRRRSVNGRAATVDADGRALRRSGRHAGHERVGRRSKLECGIRRRPDLQLAVDRVLAEGQPLDPEGKVGWQLDRRLEVRALDLRIRRADDLVERQLLERPVGRGEVDAAPGAEVGREGLGRVQQNRLRLARAAASRRSKAGRHPRHRRAGSSRTRPAAAGCRRPRAGAASGRERPRRRPRRTVRAGRVRRRSPSHRSGRRTPATGRPRCPPPRVPASPGSEPGAGRSCARHRDPTHGRSAAGADP